MSIRVDNRLPVDVGINAHSVTDHSQTNWNGIIVRIELSAGSPIWIENVQVYPEIATKSATLIVQIGNATGQVGHGSLSNSAQTIDVAWGEKGGSAQMQVFLGENAGLWDEFSPKLHEITLTLRTVAQTNSRSLRFGLREVGTQGTQITLNGHPIFLRGTL